MRLRLRQFRPRTGPHEHRVVQPWTPLRHTSLSDPEASLGILLGDHDGLNRLAGLFSFAAYSRHTIVHVPLRDVRKPYWGCGDLVDLVLVHHSAGLRPSKWPELRRRLTHSTPLTVRTDEARTARDAEAWQRRRHRTDTRDWVRHTTHARTFFLTGSRDVFASAAMAFSYAAGWGPRQRGVVKGKPAFMTSLAAELTEDLDTWRTPEVVICFQPYPPYAHFKRPGR
ncbi:MULTISPECIES: hypothetical protein [Streptomyces]|uniref:Uncharacterized protein n=1 Tax=Streptomyces dengpaensis TaxID=2049881 RepID=A0ABM6SRY2_9ACTN|nr:MULTISPECIES: hypothetical protein [Streptomyces]AVH57096.1 hypothetical protein C4B68_16365 [Streptomyces dengpaensis]PIB09003.1 hypothetical protein B1C81_12145 [Streptomyces sp. HG99]